MFSRADKFQDVQRTQSRDDELRDQFPRSQPHPAHSFEQSSSLMRIGKTVVIKGELTAAEDMVIFGHVDGTITVNDRHTVTIGKGATIEAEIKAYSVVVEGHVTGNIETAEHLEISPDGVILGNVRTPSLVIRDGGTLKGSVDMDAARPKARPENKEPEGAAAADGKSSVGRHERKARETVLTT